GMAAAEAIPDLAIRREALALLAREAGERSDRVLNRALKTARTLGDSECVARSVAALAVAVAREGREHAAIELAGRRPDLDGRGEVLVRITEEPGLSDRRRAAALAVEVIASIEGRDVRDRLSARLAPALAALGSVDETAGVAAAIESRRLRAQTWVTLAEQESALETILEGRLEGWGPPLITRMAPYLSGAQVT